jgi:hypothetical protein
MADEQSNALIAGGALRAESDTFVAQLERLADLEHTKRDIPPSDPRFLALAVEVEQAAKALLADARGQTELGDAAHTAGLSVPITAIPPGMSAAQIIVGWRDTERQLATMDPASDEAREARLMIDAYRRAYQAAFAEAQKRDS